LPPQHRSDGSHRNTSVISGDNGDETARQAISVAKTRGGKAKIVSTLRILRREL
jgi:hypothetical protein